MKDTRTAASAPRILLVSFSNTASDPRLIHHIQALGSTYRLTVCGVGDFFDPRVTYIKILARSRGLIEKVLSSLAILLGFCEWSYWSQPRVREARRLLKDADFDLIFANELSALPLAIDLVSSKKSPIIFDAHEFYPGHMPEKLKFKLLGSRLWSYLTRKYVPKADLRITVSEGIAEEYRKYCGSKFIVINNAPYFYNLRPTSPSGGKIRLVHCGGFSVDRQPECMVELLSQLDERYTLDFVFVVTPRDRAVFESFKSRYEGERLRFRDPVKMAELPRFLNQYDIGLYLLPVRSLNQKFALPNKIFEFLQGRLAIAVWPSEEMGRFVNNNRIGWVSDFATVSSMAAKLNSLTAEDLLEKKRNTELAAKKFSGEANQEKLLQGLGSLST